MSFIDVKDRIPTNVLSNEAIRYGVYDEEGELLRYEYMKREDEPIEEGTPINKVLLDNFQGDLYTQDRYNLLSVTAEETKKVDINDFVQKSTIGHSINAVATDGNGLYVAVGASGYIATSTDLINWTQQTSGTTYNLNDIAYGDGVFIAVGVNEIIIKSTDGGVTWARKHTSGNMASYSVAYGNGGFMVGGSAQDTVLDNNLHFSTDGGETWQGRDVGDGTATLYISFVNNQFVISTAYNSSTIYTAPTADSSLTTIATGITAFNSSYAYDIIYANGYYVAGGYNALAISKDLTTWTQISNEQVKSLIENDGQIIIGLDSGYLKATEDFGNIQKSSPTYGNVIGLLKEGDKIISFSSNGNIFESTTYLSEYKQYLDMPLTSYEKGKIVNIEGGRALDTNNVAYNTYTTDIIPKTWTDLSGSNINKEYVAEDGTKIFSWGGVPSNAFDGNTGSYWRGYATASKDNHIGIIFTEPKKITKLKTHIKEAYGTPCLIQGSKDGIEWVTLKSFGSNQTSLVEITLDNPDFYSQYKICFPNKVAALPEVYEVQVSEWQEVSGESTYITSFYNSMLNINNLGEKQINGAINYGQRYSLVYNGESWDIGNAKAVTGSASVVSGSPVDIELYGAKCVFVDCLDGGLPNYYLGSRLLLPNDTPERLFVGSNSEVTAKLSTGGNILALRSTYSTAYTINYVAFY